MRFLLDENLDQIVAAVLTLLGAAAGDEFQHLLTVAEAGTDDMDIPNLCKEHGFGALITVNHKDFGAKKAMYAALLAAGVHVVVVRPGKMKFTVSNQASVLAGKYPHFTRMVTEAEGCILVRVTPSDVKERTLDELLDEFK